MRITNVCYVSKAGRVGLILESKSPENSNSNIGRNKTKMTAKAKGYIATYDPRSFTCET